MRSMPQSSRHRAEKPQHSARSVNLDHPQLRHVGKCALSLLFSLQWTKNNLQHCKKYYKTQKHISQTALHYTTLVSLLDIQKCRNVRLCKIRTILKVIIECSPSVTLHNALAPLYHSHRCKDVTVGPHIT